MADIVINPAVGKIDFFSVKGDNVTNTLKLTGNTLLVTGPLSASSISTGGGGAFVTSVQPTSNYLSKFTGNSTIANSLVYDNGTNVGIGTTSPVYKLHVNGNGYFNSTLVVNADLSLTGGGDVLIYDSDGTGFFASYMDSGVAYMRVDDGGSANGSLYINSKFFVGPSTGNVGVGTSSPGGILDVQSSNAGDQLVRTWNTNTAGTGKAILRIANSGNNAQGTQLQFTDLNYFVGTIASDRTNGMAFYVGQQATALVSERMRITNTGNVGIGTTNPIYKFQVVGNAYVNAGTLLIDSGNSISWGNSTQYIFGSNGIGLSFVAATTFVFGKKRLACLTFCAEDSGFLYLS